MPSSITEFSRLLLVSLSPRGRLPRMASASCFWKIHPVLVWSGNPVVNINPVLTMSASCRCTTRFGRFPTISCHQMALACSSIWSHCMAADPEFISCVIMTCPSLHPQLIHNYTSRQQGPRPTNDSSCTVCTSPYWGHIHYHVGDIWQGHCNCIKPHRCP